MQSCTELILQEHGCTTTSPSKSDFVSWTLIAVLFSNQIDVYLFGLALDIVHIVFNCGSILLLNPMLSAERRRFFRHSHSYWETYDLSVYYFSLLVELDAAPCSARYDERCKEPCHVPAASWIWLSQACFSLRRFWRMERSVFLTLAWPRRSHTPTRLCWIDVQRCNFSSQEEQRIKMVTQNCVWFRRHVGDSELGLVGDGYGRMPGSHSSCPGCEARVSSGWAEDMHVCTYVHDELSWPSLALMHF